MAPDRGAADRPGGGHQPAPDLLRQRGGLRAGPSGGPLAAQDSAAFLRYLDALEARQAATGREIFLVLDNGPCHTSKTSRAALAARADWLHVIWLAPYCPHLNKKEREWRFLKRDAAGHLARTLRAFADEILVGLDRSGRHRAATSWTTYRSGSLMATATRPPAARRGGPRAPRTANQRSRRAWEVTGEYLA